MKRRLTWFIHVVRMYDKRLPRRHYFCHVEGTRSRGRQTKVMDNVRKDLAQKDMDMRTVLDNNHRQKKWSHLVKKRPHRRLLPDGREKRRRKHNNSAERSY